MYIPKELKELKQWVCWNTSSKVPMQCSSNSPASSTDPDTWSDFETAIKQVDDKLYDGIGFVFADNGIVGIDIDCGLDEDGFLNELACDIINTCHSFTEFSRSGRGVHIFIKGNLPFKGQNNLKGIEIYKASRYFIMTGKTLCFDEIIENQEAIDYVVAKYFNVEREKKETSSLIRRQTIYQPQYELPKDNVIKLRPTYPPIPSGARNLSLTSLAGQLKTRGYTKEQVYKEVLYCNSVACQPPLEDREVQTIINSVFRYKE